MAIVPLRQRIDDLVGDDELLALEPRDDYDPAIVGIARRFHDSFLVYSEPKLLEIIETEMDDEGPDEAAREHFEFNIVGAWVGDTTPAFLTPWRATPIELFRARAVGAPVPQGSKRVWVKDGKAMMAEDQGLRHASWRREVTAAVQECIWASHLDTPLEGPLVVGLTFFLNRPIGHYGTGKNSHAVKPGSPAYPTKPPDADKLTRAVFDSLTDARLWVDDSQVVNYSARKRWVDRFGAIPEGVDIVVGQP